MARLPLSGDIGIFIVDAEYNALQSRSISDAEIYAREKAWAYLAACRTMPVCRIRPCLAQLGESPNLVEVLRVGLHR